MNAPLEPKDPDDGLTDAYRAASAANAGRPSETTRRAILAAAQAAANRRMPVANESRYLWRGVAGVAVIGVAVMLWRQMDHRLPGQAPTVAATTNESVAEPPRAFAQDRAESEDRAESKAMSPPDSQSLPKAEAQVSAPPTQAQRQPLPAPPAPAIPPEQEITSAQLAANEAAPVAADSAGSAARGDVARSAAALTAAPQPLSDPNAALLRERFPQQNQSDTPRNVWLIRDATGPVLLSGELAAGQRPEDLLPQLTEQLGGRSLSPWRIEEVVNARGQVIRIAIAEARQ